MADYEYQNRIILDDFSDNSIESKYDEGYLFGRIERGQMDQVRSLRINLEKFSLNSENRRIQRKTDNLNYKIISLPIAENEYDFTIHKIGKEFYKIKNEGQNVFSASKIKELVTSIESNFNKLLEFSINDVKVGFAICLETDNILHYAYPFYDLTENHINLGMGMIIKAIEYGLTHNKKYFYLGSLSSSKSKYKLQFENSQWWDKDHWSSDLEKIKALLENSP